VLADQFLDKVLDELTGREQDGIALREVDGRRQYIGKPADYIEDIFGLYLTPQQGEALALIDKETRVLIPSGHNLGKTFLLGAYGVYYFDAVASTPDKDDAALEVGARILLPGPDHSTIFATVYSEMLVHARRAEARGHLMPGRRSEDSVLWKVKPKWEMEAMAPQRRLGQEQAHSASGRHADNQIALIEEGQGVSETLWRAVEGTCTSVGNKIISSFNPTENSGPTYQRAQQGIYAVIHLDGFDHPNVKTRSYIIPPAIDFKVVDDMVRECKVRGDHPAVVPDEEWNDFIYALPPVRGAAEFGPRKDGFRGHPKGKLQVFRPIPLFQARVRGEWPSTSEKGIFNAGAWDAAVKRWKEVETPAYEADRVGIDAARMGGDETIAVPTWGIDAEDLIQDFRAAQTEYDEGAMKRILEEQRIYTGVPLMIERGEGPEVATKIAHRFPRTPWIIDEAGVGASVMDHAARVIGLEVTGISFGSVPREKLPGQRLADNMRTWLYLTAAMLVNLELVDIPDDMLLREEALATEILESSKMIQEEQPDGKLLKRRKASVRIEEKDVIRQKIGRSPDRADAFVLSLIKPDGAVNIEQWVW
jgi:hypothetical protein